ncbi:unnamed protein product [Penicillium palitans]
MATQQGPARRNGVIGFQMTGAPTPAIPLIAPRRNGPIGFQMMPGSCARDHPLVGPDTAHPSSFGQTTVRSTTTERGRLETGISDAVYTDNVARNSGRQSQREASALR